ncbi:MAG: hypothetical protein R3Y11_05600 [Pseudomonadota bacterium]
MQNSPSCTKNRTHMQRLMQAPMQYLTLWLLLALCVLSLSHVALASEHATGGAKPDWVRSFLQEGYHNPHDYEGIAFLEIKGKSPTFDEATLVADRAKGALASMLSSKVFKVVNEHVAERNGVAVDEAQVNATTMSSLQLQTEKPVFWFDEGKKVLWAKVYIPRHKAEQWVTTLPDLPVQEERRKVYGLVHYLCEGGCVIRLEEGYSLRVETDDAYITAGERIFVDYVGNKPQAVYTTSGTKIEGRIVRK